MQPTTLIKALAISASLAIIPTVASAQAYPTRPIKIIVPAPPGGAIDTIARVVGDKIGASMGQPVIVDNRPVRPTTWAPTCSPNHPPTATPSASWAAASSA